MPDAQGRIGVAKNLTLDIEAVEMLEALSAGRHAQGRLLSELIRREAIRREERAQLRAAVLAAFDDEP